jgi:Asp-tRNA(Asn)/Glu-tRNA(Gln) amidotransferase A subunit family amidase
MARDDRWTRREMLEVVSLLGLGAGVLGRATGARAEAATAAATVTPEKIAGAEWVPGLSWTDDDRTLMAEDVANTLTHYEALRAVPIDNAVPPALVLHLARSADSAREVPRFVNTSEEQRAPVKRPSKPSDLAFLPVAQLAELVKTKQISSLELTKLYLARLEKHDPTLRCVISYLADTALDAAKRADEEIAAGRHKGPLHGIPWGAKDLIAARGARTTWGATPYKEQVRDENATVVTKLGDAGAVLTAKLSVGELAWGDVWYDATTKNPWNTKDGSSGSSAGSASATSAGLVGFALGTETWGSIVSPCTVCGVSGLRPTFGSVSRAGIMALSWSMDKVGPIARTVEDCALVFQAICGADPKDPATADRFFAWPYRGDPRGLRVGYLPDLFEIDRAAAVPAETEDAAKERTRAAEWQKHDQRTLAELRDLGFDLRPIEIPKDLPIDALQIILTAEAATAFDELTRSGRDDLLVRQVRDAWPNVFRQGQLIPAVEYLRANRIRTLVMRRMEELFADVDVFLAPAWEGNHLLLTNLTGQPSVVVPNGFRTDGTPTSITFTGRLYGEAETLALAKLYQESTSYHRKHPKLA